MLSRALSLATVTLLIGCLAAIPVRAQNLDSGKSPSQLFAGTCNACHKGPRGLLKTVPAGSLPGFLRQHYTTSSEMASMLAGFLIANGATDTRVTGSKSTQQPKDAKPEQLDRFGRPLRPAPTQEAARPDAEPQQAARPDADGPPGRNARRPARPGEAPDAARPAAADGQPPAQAAVAPGPDGRKAGAKQKLSKRGKPEDPAKDEPAKEDTPKSETAKETAKETGKEAAKDETTKPSAEGKSETAGVDAPKEAVTPALRPDPVPPVTPAPAVSAAVSGGPSEPVAAPTVPAAVAPPAVTASAPPLPPVAPAGPPAPPISQ